MKRTIYGKNIASLIYLVNRGQAESPIGEKVAIGCGKIEEKRFIIPAVFRLYRLYA